VSNVAPEGEITLLLRRMSAGDSSAESELMDRVYFDLKRLAARYLRGEGNRQALQATSLVNKAFERYAAGKPISFTDRTHFFAVAARIMRHLLIDEAKKRKAIKHGNGKVDSLDIDVPVEGLPSASMIDLDRAIDRLTASEPRQGKVVVLKYFGGMSLEEIAAYLNVSTKTVARDWLEARATLYGYLSPRPESQGACADVAPKHGVDDDAD
jgi:RNA polymerase sigma factor (TIGR02999 family)